MPQFSRLAIFFDERSRMAGGEEKPKISLEKGVTYNATTNDLLLDIATDVSASAIKSGFSVIPIIRQKSLKQDDY